MTDASQTTTVAPIEWAPIDDSIPPNASGGFTGGSDEEDDPGSSGDPTGDVDFGDGGPAPFPERLPPPLMDTDDRSWPTADDVIATMVSFLGTKEDPPASNCNPLTSWYGDGCVAWCAITVSKACFDAGFNDGNDAWEMPGIKPQKRRRGFAGVALLKEAFQHAQLFDQVPHKGDIFIVGADEHTGLIEDIGCDGVLHTIEGNWGDVCKRNSRTPTSSNISGYCHPPYGHGGIFTMLSDTEQAELLNKTRDLHKYFLEPVGEVGAGVPWAVDQILGLVRGSVLAELGLIKRAVAAPPGG